MARLTVFESVSLDGYFTDAYGKMDFAHRSPDDAEWNGFTAENAGGGGALLFGRITYEMMASFWPTPAAAQMMPEVAERMNDMPKFVVSRSLGKAEWKNTRVIKGDLAGEIRKLKEGREDLAILGSGSLVAQLTPHRLIDEFTFVTVPVVLGKGRTLFHGVEGMAPLTLVKTRTFGNGNVVSWYKP
jgi:dihydrofolate reductase